MPSPPTAKTNLSTGQHVVGYDFGRKQNHVVFCRVRVTTDNPLGCQITDWGALDFPKATLQQIVTTLFELTSTTTPRHCSIDGDWFLLESQPSGNSHCLAISHILQALLLSCNHSAERIIFNHASSKFNALDKAGQFKPGIPPGKQNAPARYRQRKRWAVNLCTALLETQPVQFQQFFTKLKKKDDFSDALLYAMAFVHRHPPVR